VRRARRGNTAPHLDLRAARAALEGLTLHRRARRVRQLVATVQPTFILAARRVHVPAAHQASHRRRARAHVRRRLTTALLLTTELQTTGRTVAIQGSTRAAQERALLALQASTNPRLDLRGRVAPAAAAATTRRRRGRRAVSLAPPDRGENWAWNLQAFRILKRGCFPRMSELNVNFRL
jgi:hypothetical protein